MSPVVATPILLQKHQDPRILKK